MAIMRGFWRFLIGVKDFLALIFLLIFFYILFAFLSAQPNPGAVRDGVLTIRLSGILAEQPAANDPITSLLSGEAPVNEYRQRDVIRALDVASTDDRIKAVALDLDSFLGGGLVSIAEIGEAIDRFKTSGKPVYAYATAYVDNGYHLAAHANEIWLSPMGGVGLIGPGGSQPYYKGLLDKLGVEAHIYRVGKFKSAVEPYLRSDQSTEAAEAAKAVYTEYWDYRLADIKKARPKANLAPIITDPAATVEAAKGNLSAVAKQLGLIDRTGSKTDFGEYLAAKYGKGESELTGDFAQTDMDALLASSSPADDGDPIAVITAAGEITDGEAGPGTVGGDTVSGLIYSAMADDDVKAIVLRVDSPGGSVLGSEEIRTALEKAKTKKLPIVVSMANYAASGGYWISAPANTIFAEPGTITGSIGIFAVMPSAKAALGKFGITADGTKTTPLSGEPDVLAGISPTFDRVAQSAIENGYDNFLSIVAKARGKTPAQIDAIAQGRIWAGGTARQLGLVDRLGGMDDALEEAAKLAGLKKGKWHPRYFDPQPSFALGLLGQLVASKESGRASMDMFAHANWRQRDMQGRIIDDLTGLLSAGGVQARCLECGAFVPRAGNQGQGLGANQGQGLWLVKQMLAKAP